MKSISQMNTVQSFVNRSVYSGIFLVSLFLLSSCEPDSPEVVNEDEVITTVIVTLGTDSDSILLTSRDIDGDGPEPPVVTVSGSLKTNTVYTGAVSFQNELANPDENITNEVLEEGVDHQVFYQAPAAFGTIAYTDTDANNKPIGVTFTLTTGADATTGSLTVTLRHEPNKSASGVSGGSILNAGGATDAEVVFPMEIEMP